MKVKYFKKMDSIEINLEIGIPTLGVEAENEDITRFIHKTKGHTVGYFIEGISENFNNIIQELDISFAQKIAVMAVYARGSKGLTQENVAKMAGIAITSYQRLEEGENISLETLDKVLKVFCEKDFKVNFNIKEAC